MEQYDFYVLDTETTGLNPDKGCLLSIAVVHLSPDFIPLMQVQQVISPEGGIEEAKALCDPTVLKMHTENGLFSKIEEEGRSLEMVQQHLIRFMTQTAINPNNKNILIGNSIHFDRMWINKHLPDFARLFYYRMIDVSSINILARVLSPPVADIVKNAKVFKHTALEDCYETIKELRCYIKNIFQKDLA